MAVREFDGIDDLMLLAGTGTAIANGAFTLIGIVKPTVAGGGGSSHMVLGNTLSNTFLCTIGEAGSERVACFTNTNESFSGFGPFYSTGNWQIVAITRAAASEPTRQHASIVGSGTWVHDQGGGVIPLDATICDSISIAAYFTGVIFEKARYKAFAIYDRELTDAQVETLATPTAQKLADYGATQLILLNQASPSDLVSDLIGDSDQTSVVGTTVVGGDDPSGWSDAYTPATEFRLSGGAANSDPALALGGALSSVACSGTLLDAANRAEALSGAVEYRCVYIKNNSASALNCEVWIADQPGTITVAVGAAVQTAGNPAAAIANSGVAPPGVTFSTPSAQGAGLSLGSIPSGSYRGLWVRRTIPATHPGGVTNRWEIRAADVDTTRPKKLIGNFDVELPIDAPSAFINVAGELIPITVYHRVPGGFYPPLS